MDRSAVERRADAPSKGLASRWRDLTWEAAVIVLAPVVSWWLLGIVLINQDNFVDPWFYMGYGRQFVLLHELFGWLYYSVRFPVIFLNEAFSHLGPLAGYAALRYVLVLACGIPLYAWARLAFGRPVALVSYLFLIWNPLLPRVMLWDLTTFVSVPMALAGMALWLVSDDRRSLRFLSGFALTASVASHLFTGTAIAIFLAFQALRRIRSRQLRGLIVLDVLSTAGGAVTCLALGYLYFYSRVGPFDPMVVVTVTRNAMGVGDVYAETHRTPFSGWRAMEYQVYVPLISVAVSAALLGRRALQNTAVSSVWWFAASYASVYLVYQFVLGRFVLETFYYFAHLTIVVFLLIPVILSEITWKLSPESRRWAVAVSAAALVSIPLINHFLPTVVDGVQPVTFGNVRVLIALGLLATVTTVAARRLSRHPVTACVALAAFMLLVQVFTFLNPTHRGVFDSRRRAREEGLYLATARMLDVFAAYSTPKSMVMLWYCERQPSLLSIGSSVLLFTVHDSFASDSRACDGTLGTSELVKLTQYPVRYVLMLDESGSSFASREAALREAGYVVRTVRAETIGDDAYATKLRLVQIDNPPQ